MTVTRPKIPKPTAGDELAGPRGWHGDTSLDTRHQDPQDDADGSHEQHEQPSPPTTPGTDPGLLGER
jgi:hypothetical protein